MSLSFGAAEATALLELIASGANKAAIFRHFSVEGAEQMGQVVNHFPLADIEPLKEELEHLQGLEQSNNTLAQQAFVFGALNVVLGYLVEMDETSPVTQELMEFLANHPVLTLSEMVEGMDDVIAEARSLGAPEADVAEMVAKREEIAARAAAEAG
jgi:hypothetical protein